MTLLFYVLAAVSFITIIGVKVADTYPHLMKTEHDPSAFTTHDHEEEPEPTGAFDWWLGVTVRKAFE